MRLGRVHAKTALQECFKTKILGLFAKTVYMTSSKMKKER
jgi:hypothetical protein